MCAAYADIGAGWRSCAVWYSEHRVKTRGYEDSDVGFSTVCACASWVRGCVFVRRRLNTVEYGGVYALSSAGWETRVRIQLLGRGTAAVHP